MQEWVLEQNQGPNSHICCCAPYRIKYFAPQKFVSDTRHIVHLHYIYACNSVWADVISYEI